jgi:hypothetical protein
LATRWEIIGSVLRWPSARSVFGFCADWPPAMERSYFDV